MAFSIGKQKTAVAARAATEVTIDFYDSGSIERSVTLSVGVQEKKY